MTGIADFTAQLFQPLVGQAVQWERPGGGTARLELLEVQTYPRQPGMTRDPFSLLFELKGQKPIEPGLPRLVHPGFEPCELLLSRVRVPEFERAHRAGVFYEAVFS